MTERKKDFSFQYGFYPNTLRQKLKSGKVAWGTIIWDLPYPSTAEAIRDAGFDWVWIDMEHSPATLETVTAFLRTSQPLGLTTFVRVPDAEYHLIARTLDCGVSGIIVPRVSDRITAERIVSSCRYPPDGCRGVGFHSMVCSNNKLYLKKRLKRINEEIMVIIQIETAGAIKRIEKIVSVPGIDAVILGPTDLTVSMGIPGEYENPKTLSVFKKLIGLSKKYPFLPGCHYDNPELAVKVANLGAKIVSTSSDIIMLKAGCSEVIRFLNRESKVKS